MGVMTSRKWLRARKNGVITYVSTLMTMQLKVTRVGNSLGIVLPKEAANRLNVEAGDSVFITESPDGFRITADNPEFAKQMRVAGKVMKKYRNTLRELAK